MMYILESFLIYYGSPEELGHHAQSAQSEWPFYQTYGTLKCHIIRQETRSLFIRPQRKTEYSSDVIFCGEDRNYTHKCKSPKTKYPYLHDRGYDKLGYSRELLIKVEGLLRKRALAEGEREISDQNASIDLAREDGNGCFDYSDEEGHKLEDFDCNIIYADMLLQNARRGIFTYTDQEAKKSSMTHL